MPSARIRTWKTEEFVRVSKYFYSLVIMFLVYFKGVLKSSIGKQILFRWWPLLHVYASLWCSPIFLSSSMFQNYAKCSYLLRLSDRLGTTGKRTENLTLVSAMVNRLKMQSGLRFRRREVPPSMICGSWFHWTFEMLLTPNFGQIKNGFGPTSSARFDIDTRTVSHRSPKKPLRAWNRPATCRDISSFGVKIARTSAWRHAIAVDNIHREAAEFDWRETRLREISAKSSLAGLASV